MRCRPIALLAALPLIAASLAGCSGRADRPDDGGPGATTGAAGTASEAPAAAEPPSPAPTATADPSSPTPTPAPAASDAAVPRVSIEEARALHDSGAAVIVDVRDPASYGVAHIAGAVHIPLGEVTARAGELPRDKRIITYCS